MAKDWDFQKTSTKPKTIKAPQTFGSGNHKKPRNFRQLHYLWLLALIVIGLIFITLGLIQESAPSAQSSPTTPTSTSKENSDSNKNIDNNIFTTQPSADIQIYDGGAGTQRVDQLINQLKENKLTAVNLGRSQFDYTGTTIWFVPEEEALAKRVGDSLSDTQITYKKSQLGAAAGFKVLVYLGK